MKKYFFTMILLFMPFISYAQASIVELECATASTTDCIYFQHLHDNSTDILALQNPFYFILTLIIVLLPSILILLTIFFILKFLTFLWVWFKL